MVARFAHNNPAGIHHGYRLVILHTPKLSIQTVRHILSSTGQESEPTPMIKIPGTRRGVKLRHLAAVAAVSLAAALIAPQAAQGAVTTAATAGAATTMQASQSAGLTLAPGPSAPIFAPFQAAPDTGAASIHLTIRRALASDGPLNVCSADVGPAVQYQTCLRVWLSGPYGNDVSQVQGTYALFRTGQLWCHWIVAGYGWQWSLTQGCGFQWYEPTPWRGGTGYLGVGRYVPPGTSITFTLYSLIGGSWVNQRNASITIY